MSEDNKNNILGAEGKPISDDASNLEVQPNQGAAFPEIDFSGFIVSFATQALMQLGEIKAPEGVSVPLDKVAAKQTIDIIAMLEAKTKGNLSTHEVKLIEEILHNLRLSYLRVINNSK